MKILKVIKVREGLLRVVTDEREILIEEDGEVKSFGDSHIVLEGPDSWGLIDINTLECETLNDTPPMYIDTNHYFGRRLGMTVSCEEEQIYANRIIAFMKTIFDNNDEIEDIDDLCSHLFKLCVSKNNDLETVFQIIKLHNYDETQFDDPDFYIAYSLAELFIDSNNP